MLIHEAQTVKTIKLLFLALNTKYRKAGAIDFQVFGHKLKFLTKYIFDLMMALDEKFLISW